eukprot:s560_g3.t1
MPLCLPVEAARWLSGAAQKAGTSLARLSKGLSAEGLKADLESRASSTPESLEAYEQCLQTAATGRYLTGAVIVAVSAVASLDDDCDKSGSNLLQSFAQARRAEKYAWQSGRGNFPNFAVAEANGPFNLSETLSWSWHHPKGRFHTLTWGTVLDNHLNVYLSAADGLRKFDADGKLLWEHHTLPAILMNAPAIYQGSIFASDTLGGVRALSMSTGKLLWYSNLSKPIGEDNGFTMVHEGVVFTAADWRDPSPMGAANHAVKALNASDGQILWTYEPDAPVWNFLPLFPDRESWTKFDRLQTICKTPHVFKHISYPLPQDTFVFQDMTGRVYRLSLQGKLLWKAGGKSGTWTDGGAALGNGMVYAVNNNHLPNQKMFNSEYTPGTLSAYDLNGTLKWKITTPRPPNNAPAIGKVQGWSGLSVILPICQQVMQGATCEVQAYDANTGGLRWVFHGPTQTGPFQAGDFEGMADRTASGVRPVCLPNGWSAPSISSDGTVFVGNENGPLFALRDADGDGRVVGNNEVSFFDSKAAFSGSASPAIGNNLLAVASCDTLFASTLPGCEGLLLRLPQLLADTRPYESHQWAQQVAMSLKADGHSEQLRSQRTLSAQRAEQLRAQLRDQPAPTTPAAAEEGLERCRSSADAVRNYLAFRVSLDEAASRLKSLREERHQTLRKAQQSLADLESAAEKRAQSADERREAILQDRDARLEESWLIKAKKLGMRRKGRAAGPYGFATAEGADLRPVKFYKVLAPKAACMTEGEIQAALRRTTERLKTLAKQFQSAGTEGLMQKRHELQQQQQKLDAEAFEALQQHSRLELQHLDQAGTRIASCLRSLLDVARARADLMARGLSPELEDIYSIAAAPRRQDMQELRGALNSVEVAWQEATGFWDPSNEGPQKVKDLSAGVLLQLEAAQKRISQSLQQLQRADPDLYELALMGEEDLGQMTSEQRLPHGWEALATEEGVVYYHNLVSGLTQWEVPAQDAAVCAGWRLFQAEDGGWFYHNPYDGNGVWWPELPTYPVEPDSLESLRKEAAEG